MMKPDIDTDTEKYSSHSSGNNMFIKTFSDPENLKISLKMALTKKVSYYTFPLTSHTFLLTNYTFPPLN